MSCLKSHVTGKLDDQHAAQLVVDPKTEGWCEITGAGARALVYIRPQNELTVSLRSKEDHYAPGQSAELQIQTTVAGKGGKAAVGLFGVDSSLGQLVTLPGPTELGFAALILPAVAVGAHLTAMLARMTRGAMLDVLGEDYVRTARAKGVPEWRVLFVHALRNALLPVITVAGMQFGSLLSGAIIVEKVFARPGVGTTLLDAIAERDYPVVQGTVLVIAVTYVLVNIAVDVAYGLVDPRIRVA